MTRSGKTNSIWQFSLRTMLCFVTAGLILLALNLSPTVVKGEMSTTLYDPTGAWDPIHDTISLERGFPFRYQQTEAWFEHRTVTDGFAESWHRSIGVRVTHVHWLLVNIACGLVAAVAACVLVGFAVTGKSSDEAGDSEFTASAR